MRRADTWLPWIREFETEDPVLDPTFLGSHTLDDPPSWLLEAVAGGVEVWLDDDGRLAARLATIGDSVRSGTWQRRTFMGLPYYRRAAS